MTAADDKAGRVFDQEQLEVLTASAVERETASLVAEKSELSTQVASLTEKAEALETEKAELQNKIDVLEAEKAAAEKAAVEAAAAFEAHKAAEAEKAAAELRKSERLEAVKAAAGDMGEEYFTDARIARWAEMSQEHFDALLSDLTEVAKTKSVEVPANVVEAARESAAFSGGETPTAASEHTLAGFFAASGKLPAAN